MTTDAHRRTPRVPRGWRGNVTDLQGHIDLFAVDGVFHTGQNW